MLDTGDLSPDEAAKIKKRLAFNNAWNRAGGRSRNYVRAFSLRLTNSRLCVRSEGESTVKNSRLVLAPCLRGTF